MLTGFLTKLYFGKRDLKKKRNIVCRDEWAISSRKYIYLNSYKHKTCLLQLRLFYTLNPEGGRMSQDPMLNMSPTLL